MHGTVYCQRLENTLSNFIPKGYMVLDTATGDLNLDEYRDLILVLQKHNESDYAQDMDAPAKRPLLLLTGQSGGGYKIAGRNDNAVLCSQCGHMMEDPFYRVVIKKGYFTVEHYYGSRWINWKQYITYRYYAPSATWQLFKISTESYNPDYPDDVGVEVKTKKDFGNITFTTFNIYRYEKSAGE
jgi:hypothetical protein